MTIEEIGDAFLIDFISFYYNNVHSPRNIFTYDCKEVELLIEIHYSLEGDKSMNIERVSCLSREEVENDEEVNVSQKGVFTKTIQYLLHRLGNKKFRVVLNNVTNQAWIAKLLERGWIIISKHNDNTSLYMTLETF